MKNLKIVVVGPGLIGKRHIELIRNSSDCQLAGIVAPDRFNHHHLAHRLNVPLYHELDSLLRSESVDAVIISSPNIFHAEQASICIEAGLPVLIEKPITHSGTTAAVLVELIEKKSAKVLIGHHRAHSPILSAARELIQSGKLGRLVGIMGSAIFYKPDSYFEAGPWRREIGGGPILINLIHEIGNFRSLCGEISAVQAIASSGVRDFPVEDTVVINLQFASGALGTFMLSDTIASAKSWEQTSQENKDFPSYEDEDCYHVAGTHGSLSIPTMRLKYFKNELERSWLNPFVKETLCVERVDPLECQLLHFINVIKNIDKPLISGMDGFINLKVTEAIINSTKTNKYIKI